MLGAPLAFFLWQAAFELLVSLSSFARLSIFPSTHMLPWIAALSDTVIPHYCGVTTERRISEGTPAMALTRTGRVWSPAATAPPRGEPVLVGKPPVDGRATPFSCSS